MTSLAAAEYNNLQENERGTIMEEKKNKNSQARIKANNKYVEKAYDRITVRVPKGYRTELAEQVKPDSVNGFILKAIEEKKRGSGTFDFCTNIPDLDAYARDIGLTPEEYVKLAVVEKMERQDQKFTESVTREQIEE